MKYSVGAFRNINRILAALVLFVCLGAFLFSQEVNSEELAAAQGAETQVNEQDQITVDREELESNQTGIEFINYVGPHAIVESTNQIRDIGYAMGTAVKAGAVQTGDQGRYFVIHSVSGEDGAKTDADILGFGVDAGVDHINNVRLIIQGYLEGAYDYSAADASLLARFVTIYNAVYRSNTEYFSSVYKTPVMNNLTADKAGLSVRYDEWPGRTLMVIPLMTGEPGSLSAIDTSPITDENVIDEMREEEDMGLDDRRDMVDLQEREAEEATQEAEQAREAIEEEEQRIEEEQQQIEEEREAIEEARQAAEEIEDPEERAEAEEAIEAREEEVAQREEELEEAQEAVEEQVDEAEQAEELAETRTEEAQQAREDIAEDQQTLIEQEEAVEEGILGLAINDAASHLGRIVKLNPESGEQIRISALDTVSARTFNIVDGKVLAVAGENARNGAIRLVEIDPANLEINRQGNDDIDPDSYLWVNGSDLYAITVMDGRRFLAKFDQSFVKTAQSRAEVHQWAAVTFQNDVILTQKPDGSVMLLNAADLTETVLK
jgi:hypothetical protein